MWIPGVRKRNIMNMVDELHQVIIWLTGFSEKDLQRLIEKEATFEQFFPRSLSDLKRMERYFLVSSQNC